MSTIQDNDKMKAYYFEGTWRQAKAIGITYPFKQMVMATSYDEAVLKLYDGHEMIHIDRCEVKP